MFFLPSPMQWGRARAPLNFRCHLPSLNRSDDTEILAQGESIRRPTLQQKFVLVYILLVATMVVGRGFQPRTMKTHP